MLVFSDSPHGRDQWRVPAQEPLGSDILRPGDGHSERAGLSASPVWWRGRATFQSYPGPSQTLTAIRAEACPPRRVRGPGGRGTSGLLAGQHGVHGLAPVWERKRLCVCACVCLPLPDSELLMLRDL